MTRRFKSDRQRKFVMSKMRRKSIRRKVQKVIDGDTFRVRRNIHGSQYIRLASVNAPERGQRGYYAAKGKLGRLKGKTVTIKPRGKSYGRVVADVTYKRKRVR